MNVALWGAQCLLAAVFLGSGLAKGTMTRERMVETGQTGVRDLPLPLIRVIATCEILGAMGLVLPRLFGVATWLTPLAAMALASLMVGAARIHWRQKEPKSVAVNAVLFGLALFVAYGRR